MNVKSEKPFLKVRFDSTEIVVELRLFSKKCLECQITGVKKRN